MTVFVCLCVSACPACSLKRLLMGAELYRPPGGSVQVSGLSVCLGWLCLWVWV